jgi:ABC-type amino acid transport substrate-binding protein
MDRGVQAALENKYDSIVDLELALRAKLTGTASDDSINASLELLEDEANALNEVLDEDSDTEPSIAVVGPADAEALQNAIFKAENAIKQSGTVQSLLNAAAVLVGTLRQAKAPA